MVLRNMSDSNRSSEEEDVTKMPKPKPKPKKADRQNMYLDDNASDDNESHVKGQKTAPEKDAKNLFRKQNKREKLTRKEEAKQVLDRKNDKP